MGDKPIFVHSLFRSGSTYVFNAFRRSEGGYWCYQEPLNEYVRHVADAPERLLAIDAHQGSMLRHPVLDKPYFWEFYQIREAIAPLFRKAFSYDEFFIGMDHPSFDTLKTYLQALIDNAKGRPFLQCCRTFGRLVALRDAFDGLHVHLWRNPHDQWWSYQVGDYFNATMQLIFNAPGLPARLGAVKDSCGIPDFHSPDVEEELEHARSHRLGARDSYLAFYALWLYSFLASERTAHLSINIDALSESAEYRQRTLSSLGREGVQALDFSDCNIAQAPYATSDDGFFAEGEDRIHGLFQSHGVTTDAAVEALELLGRHKPSSRQKSVDHAIVASHIRQVALWQMDLVAQTQKQTADRENALANAHRLAAILRADVAEAAALSAAQQREIVSSQAALAARGQELAGARAKSDALAAELANVKTQVATLADDLADTRGRVDGLGAELASARQHSARLHEELIAAGSRLEEAGRETDRWWTVADDASRHLATIYHSRSWRLTASLREINAWRKRALGKAKTGAATLDSLPRHAMRRVLLGAWAYAHERPERRARLVRLLAPFPRLYARLRTFAFARAPAAPSPVIQLEPDTMPDSTPAINGIQSDDLPRSVRQAYRQLMEARKAPSRSADRQIRTQTPH